MSQLGFRLIVLTAPTPHPQEHQVLEQLLVSGVPTRVHLRRPGWSRAATAAWLRTVPEGLLTQVVLHAHHALAHEFDVGGVHLTAAARLQGSRVPLRLGLTCSTALHSLAEVHSEAPNYDYVFLSPIFDSISKTDYPSAFTLSEVSASLQTVPQARVVALGGIKEQTLSLAHKAGFAGAAVLGAVWEAPDPLAALWRLQTLVSSLG